MVQGFEGAHIGKKQVKANQNKYKRMSTNTITYKIGLNAYNMNVKEYTMNLQQTNAYKMH